MKLFHFRLRLFIRQIHATAKSQVTVEYDGDKAVLQSSVELEGDTNGNYAAWNPASGKYTITATPFCGSGASGTAGSAYAVQLNVN